MSAFCLRALRINPGPSAAPSSSRHQGLALGDFELWRPRVAGWLRGAAVILVLYWLAWFFDRGLVATERGASYIAFEQAFPLADVALAAAALAASGAIMRRHPSALVWLSAVGGAAAYLACLDILYDVQHGIYGHGGGGLIELAINVVTLVSGLGVLSFAWRFRRQLLGDG